MTLIEWLGSHNFVKDNTSYYKITLHGDFGIVFNIEKEEFKVTVYLNRKEEQCDECYKTFQAFNAKLVTDWIEQVVTRILIKVADSTYASISFSVYNDVEIHLTSFPRVILYQTSSHVRASYTESFNPSKCASDFIYNFINYD